MSDLSLWEILVPTQRMDRPDRFFTTRYHRIWDEKVKVIAGGLTVLTPASGQWKDPEGETIRERVIPVRIACSEAQINQIIDLTLDHYNQIAVFCYQVSDKVIIRYREESYASNN